jgi:mycothiol synthase
MRLFVVPDARGRGVEELLMSFMEGYLRKRGVKNAIARYYMVDPWFKAVTEKAGLTEVRRFSFLDFHAGQELPRAQLPSDVVLDRYDFRHATREQLQAFLDIDNETFAEHWGHAAMPLDRVMDWQKVTEDVHCITLARSGGRAIGVTFLEDSVLYNRQNGTSEGWVNVLGVVKERRRQGLGRALLVDSIHWLLDRGLDTIHIGVDTENARALTLYTGTGFKLMTQTVIVRKELRRDGA